MKYLLLIAFLVIGKMNAADCSTTTGRFTECTNNAVNGDGCTAAAAPAPELCTACADGFFASTTKGGCERCPDNCATCSLNGSDVECATCAPGFFVDSTNNACTSPVGCATVGGYADITDLATFLCNSCMDGYALVGDSCISCTATAGGGMAGCATCTAPADGNAGSTTNPLVCTGIMDNYFLDSSGATATATACPANCRTCSDATTCTQCAIEYVLLPVNDFVPTAQQGTCQNIGIVDDFFGSSAITSVVALASLVAFFRF